MNPKDKTNYTKISRGNIVITRKTARGQDNDDDEEEEEDSDLSNCNESTANGMFS